MFVRFDKINNLMNFFYKIIIIFYAGFCLEDGYCTQYKNDKGIYNIYYGREKFSLACLTLNQNLWEGA